MTTTARLPDTFPPGGQADDFLDRLCAALPVLVLSGAGISAGTGIPTYRDARGVWLRSAPITHQEFVRDARKRQRYWGRSQLGWPAVRDATPAAAHRYLTNLEQRGALTHILTQNVDRLHQRAGSSRVTDLHGRLDRVICLDCGENSCREHMQLRLEHLNAQLRAPDMDLRPDGDADLPDELVEQVRVPACEACGGTLMPDVVFFGGSVPAERVSTGREALLRSGGLLVVGSSLQVYSGFRYCRWAKEAGLPIFIINPGSTRADAMAFKWNENADAALEAVLHELP